MKVIVPCCGASTRFPNQPPKWMLPAHDGRPMICLAVAGLQFPLDDLIVTVLAEHEQRFHVIEGLARAFGRAVEVVVLEQPTRSQSETIAETLRRTALNEPFLVKDSDNTFRLDDLEQSDNYICTDSLNNYDSINPRNKSYLQVDHNNVVTNIREKVVISDVFNVGGYFFTQPSALLEFYGRLADNAAAWNREIYLSDVIGAMILEGIPFRARPVTGYHDWGTVREWRRELLLRKTYFVPLDGLLLERGSEYFHPRFEQVQPHEQAVRAIRDLVEQGHALCYLSIRPASLADVTERQIEQFQLPPGKVVYGCPIGKWVLLGAPHPTLPFRTVDALEIQPDDVHLRETLGGESLADRVSTDTATARLRVLHVLNGAEGGAALSTLELIRALQSQEGVESSLVCHAEGSATMRDQLCEAVGGRALFLPLYWWNRKRRTRWWRRPVSELRQWWRTGCLIGSTAKVADFASRQQANLVHTSTLVNLEGARAARKLGLSHVWHVRELLGSDQPFQLPLQGHRLHRFLLANADRIVANSRTTAESLLRYAGVDRNDDALADRLSVVYNGIDVERFAGVEHDSSRRPVVVAMVASLTSEWKRHDLFIDASANVPGHLPVAFRIYGHGATVAASGKRADYAHRMRQRVRDAQLDDRFEWAGFVSDPVEIMRQIDVLVQPTVGESFGRVVVEAMAAGVPVVGFDDGTTSEIVQHDVTGLLAASGSTRGLAECIERLVSDTPLRQQLGAAARHDARQRFSIARAAREVATIYADACCRRWWNFRQIVEHELALGFDGGCDHLAPGRSYRRQNAKSQHIEHIGIHREEGIHSFRFAETDGCPRIVI